MKRLGITALLVIMLGQTQCSDGASGPAEANAPAGFTVSNSFLPGARSQSINASSALADDANDVTYLSASPGTFSSVTSVTIVNRTTNAPEIVVPVVNGGFDPVAVKARATDDILVKVTSASGSTTFFSVKVPAKRPPRVVRTSPSKGGIDIALNVQVIVVFSEPIATASVTSSTIKLTHNGQSVSGSLRISDDGLKVVFTPFTPLEPLSNYAVVVGTGIRDADGEGLDNETSAQFTTTSQSPGAPGFGNISGTLLDSATGGPPMDVALPRITATPLNGGPAVTFGAGFGSSAFASGALTAGPWRLAIQMIHGWSAVFPGLTVYRDTSVTVNVTADQTTVIPPILLRPRPDLILIGVNTCPFPLPDPPSLDDWGNCDSGYWGGALVQVEIKGIEGTATAGATFNATIGNQKYVWPTDNWRDNAWSAAIDIAIAGDYDVKIVSVNPTPSGLNPTVSWRLVPWEKSVTRGTARGLGYVGFDFYYH